MFSDNVLKVVNICLMVFFFLDYMRKEEKVIEKVEKVVDKAEKVVDKVEKKVEEEEEEEEKEKHSMGFIICRVLWFVGSFNYSMDVVDEY